MATSQLRQVIQVLRQATLPSPEGDLTDGQLLGNYLRSREEAAFAALVRRHGPMVWGTCRRMLHSPQDAEDAFQATFLVLVRKAASIVPREMVGNWLYGVARHVALKARATAARRQAREKQVIAMPEPAAPPHEFWDDVQPLLDQELGRLPDKYRAVLVLCDLEGKTRKEAARHFGLPEGTVATRLATARSMLARRLSRHGLALSSGALAAVLSQQVASANVPLAVMSSTIQAASLAAAGQAAAGGMLSVRAAELAEGVLKAMLLNKLKIVTGALLLLGVVLGAAAIARQELAARPAERSAVERPAQADPPDRDKPEGEKDVVTVSGVVNSVDAEKNTVTVTHKEGKGTFAVARDAAIKINGKPNNLAGLQSGARIRLGLLRDPKTVRSVEAVGPSVSGVVRVIDADKSSLTLENGDGLQTFTLTKNAGISIEGKPGKLAAVPVGARVLVSWFIDLKTAREVQAMGATYFNVVVKAVDVEKHTIAFVADTGPGEVAGQTFAVARDAMIRVDGRDGKLAEVPPGAHLQVDLSLDGKTVRGIGAEGPGFPGLLVKATDVEKHTITFAADKGPAEVAGKTFAVTRATEVRVDGRPGKLAELPPGASVDLSLSADQKTARRIEGYGPQWQGVVVKVVDAEKGTLTLEDNDFNRARDLAGKTYLVARDALILIDGKSGKLAAVPSGAILTLNLSVDQKTARAISAEGPQRVGVVVKAVNAGKNTITFAEDRGPEDVAGKTFLVGQGVDIRIEGRPAKLTELPVGANITVVLSADQKSARRIEAEGPQVFGVVKGVDAAKNSIDVEDREGEKTFAVPADTNILIDGKPGKVTEVPVGANVNVVLSVDQKSARNISATGAQIGGAGAVVVSVDAAKNTITIDIKGEGEKTFTVARDAAIAIDNKPAKLAAVPKEALVTLTLRVDQKTVGRIDVKGP
jgi:RNA polymerase sigma factor (sigma-70 family)